MQEGHTQNYFRCNLLMFNKDLRGFLDFHMINTCKYVIPLIKMGLETHKLVGFFPLIFHIPIHLLIIQYRFKNELNKAIG